MYGGYALFAVRMNRRDTLKGIDLIVHRVVKGYLKRKNPELRVIHTIEKLKNSIVKNADFRPSISVS